MCMCDYVTTINQVYKESNGGKLMGLEKDMLS